MRRLFHGLVFLNVVVYCSYAYIFIFSSIASGVKPLYLYFVTISFALGLLIWKPVFALHTASRPLAIWLWICLCHGIIMFLYSSQSDDTIQELITYCESVALLGTFLVLFTYDTRVAKTTCLALVLVLVFGVIMNIVDFFNPTWSEVPGRAAGFYLNPNVSGKILLLSMVASIAVIPRWLRLSYCIVAGIGILVTFSRSAWLLWAVAIIGLAGAGYLGFRSRRASVILIGGLGVFILYSLLTGAFLQFVNANGLSEYLTPATTARLGGGKEVFEDTSAVQRADFAEADWALIQKHLLFGVGIDPGIGSHNMYLSTAARGGVIGLGIFIGLLFVLWFGTTGIGKALLATYAAQSLFDHNMLDQPAMLVFLALIAAMEKKPYGSVTPRAVSRGVVHSRSRMND